MDWVWRICLGFAAMWIVKETDIGMVADMRTDNGLIINSVVQASIATLGALPLCFKTIGLMNGKKNGNHKTQERKQPTSTTSLPRNGMESGNTSSPSKPLTKLDLGNSKSITINAPKNLDYRKRCVIHWFVKEGDIVAKGGKIFTVSETLAYDEEKKSFTLTADKEYQISKRHAGTVSGVDDVIQHEDVMIVELLTKEGDVASDTGDQKPSAQQKLRNVDASRNANNRKRKTKKQIETDLNGLKKLKEDGLISDEVWKEKQKQILEDY